MNSYRVLACELVLSKSGYPLEISEFIIEWTGGIFSAEEARVFFLGLVVSTDAGKGVFPLFSRVHAAIDRTGKGSDFKVHVF